MKTEVIYEKKYPRIDYVKEYEKIAAETAADAPAKKQTAEEFLKDLCENTRYVPIPKRFVESKRFIEVVIEVSELYELDLKITRYVDCIDAQLSFDFGGNMKYINNLFGMADEISFFKDKSGRDLGVALIFYTHVVERHGVAIAP